MDVLVRVLNGLLMIAIPLGLALWLSARKQIPWAMFFAGAATFVLSQVGHLPFNQFLLSPFTLSIGWVSPEGALTLAGAVLFGLSAGVFEEVARYLVLRYWKRDVRDWDSGMMFGAGHGGIEAVLLGGLALTALMQAIAVRGVDDLSTLVAPEQVGALRASLDAYWSLPWYAALLGAFERLLAITLHLSLTLIVIQSLRADTFSWLGAAILWHAFADALVVFVAAAYGAFAAEAALLVPTAGSLAWIIYTRRTWQVPVAPDLPPPERPQVTKADPMVDRTEIDASKYQ